MHLAYVGECRVVAGWGRATLVCMLVCVSVDLGGLVFVWGIWVNVFRAGEWHLGCGRGVRGFWRVGLLRGHVRGPANCLGFGDRVWVCACVCGCGVSAGVR